MEALLKDIPIVYLGFFASLCAGLATALGAVPILFTRKISQRAQDVMLGFGAGVMLAATSFSLIVPGIEAAFSDTGSKPVSALIITAGMLLGGLFLRLSDKYSPHEHFIKGPEGADPRNLKRVWLFIIAITLHNFPEGLAVGVGFGGGDVSNGVALAVGIGLQNIPEGLVVALALLTEKYSKSKALFIPLLTGLVEPVGGLIGAGLVTVARPVLPWGLAFAAGAMLFVISDEIIPESHRKGFEKEATFGVMIGFVIMMFLDVTLG
ncbi:MAG TPA: ZIP family metal transporter [Thermodesulfobacteriota bacterium]|nr:ZIP family metal transporter [Thermodesulfobacteriota bacterium]